MSWLVTGGAGYVGSHVVRQMAAAGERVVVLDDLSAGSAARLPDGVPLEKGGILDRERLDRVLGEHEVSGVVHVAARKQVGESVERPLDYYRDNLEGLRTVLEASAAAGVRSFLFSSSAAVYGMPDVDLVTEDTPCAPMSPYGETKLAGEWLVRAAGLAHGMSTACLRYFNVAGAASPELADEGVFNLIPMVFDRLSRGEAPLIFGDDYPTADGTCERDFVHAEDVASAHLAAARRLADDPDTRLVVNVGRGEGASVAQMAEVILEVTGRRGVRPEVAARRPGDPARVIAAADRALAELDWSARYGVRDMVESAWQGWCLRHPEARL